MNNNQQQILKTITIRNNVDLRNPYNHIYELVKGEHGTYDEYYDYHITFYLDENDQYIKKFDIKTSTSDKPYINDEDTIELWNKFYSFVTSDNKHLTFYELMILYFGEL